MSQAKKEGDATPWLATCPGCGGQAFGPVGPNPELLGHGLTMFGCNHVDCPSYFFDAVDHNDAIAQFNRRAPQAPVRFLPVGDDCHTTSVPEVPRPRLNNPQDDHVDRTN